jgi:hypothetical protein
MGTASVYCTYVEGNCFCILYICGGELLQYIVHMWMGIASVYCTYVEGNCFSILYICGGELLQYFVHMWRGTPSVFCITRRLDLVLWFETSLQFMYTKGGFHPQSSTV